MTKSHRIPSFDGFRALSIFLVVISHSFGGLGEYIGLGNLGVRIFFIISAYLIIGILFRSAQRSDLSLKRFYFKRLARTLPAFYFYLIIAAAVMFYFGKFEWSQFWRAPVFLENYHPRETWTPNQWFVGHSWSLAVEEQFYLLSALVFFTFQLKGKSLRWLNTILISVMILPSMIRLGYIFLPVPEILSGSTMRSFETVADALAVGGLFYLNKEWIFSKSVVRFIKHNIYIAWIATFAIPMLGSHFMKTQFGFAPSILYSAGGILLLNIFIAILLVHYAETPRKTAVWKLLNTNWMIQIGLLSYSIYLWQQIWLYHWDLPLAVRILGIAISALLSYHLVEKPVLAWRDRVAASMNKPSDSGIMVDING